MPDSASSPLSSTPSTEPIITALPDAQSTPSDSKKTKFQHEAEVPADVPAEAGPSRPPVSDRDGEKTPVVTAVPLPEEVSVKEEFYDLRMGWSGKVYEMRVGGSDM